MCEGGQGQLTAVNNKHLKLEMSQVISFIQVLPLITALMLTNKPMHRYISHSVFSTGFCQTVVGA